MTAVFSVSQIILYKDAWTPMQGSPLGEWLPVAHAFTAQTFQMPFDYLKTGGAVIVQATLLIVWQALSPTAWTGVGLFATPGGPGSESKDLSKISPWYRYVAANDVGPSPATQVGGPNSHYGCWPSTNPGGPHPCWLDVTDDLNKLIADGIPLNLSIGTFGNNSNGPLVYDVELQIMWGVPQTPTAAA